MEIGNISDRYTRLTHPFTEELLKLAKEHPDYPITVLAGEGANAGGEYSWMYATQVSAKIEEALDCNTEWWKEEFVCTDRDDFEDYAYDRIWVKLTDELGREPTSEEQEAAWKEIKEAHEPYWKKCIAITADN